MAIAALLSGLAACSPTRAPGTDPSVASPIYTNELSASVQRILPATVQIFSVNTYRVRQFAYARARGRRIPTPEGPERFQLAPDGVAEENRNIKAVGGGLIVGEAASRWLVLTARHIVVQQDTIVDYYHENGRPTEAVRVRAVLTRSDLGAREGMGALDREAALLVSARRSDLALVTVDKTRSRAKLYGGKVIHDLYPIWGKLGVIAGFPDGVLQVSMGLANGSPYPGNFGIDIEGTFGYSGGPVFLIDRRGGLALAGVARSVPGRRIFVVTPDSTLQFEAQLLDRDMSHLRIEQIPLLSRSRMYAVDVNAILAFLRKNRNMLRAEGYVLSGAIRDRLDD